MVFFTVIMIWQGVANFYQHCSAKKMNSEGDIMALYNTERVCI